MLIDSETILETGFMTLALDGAAPTAIRVPILSKFARPDGTLWRNAPKRQAMLRLARRGRTRRRCGRFVARKPDGDLRPPEKARTARDKIGPSI
jgi:hypothetical protein